MGVEHFVKLSIFGDIVCTGHFVRGANLGSVGVRVGWIFDAGLEIVAEARFAQFARFVRFAGVARVAEGTIPIGVVAWGMVLAVV